MSKDQVVLSYDESLLRKSDVDLLRGNFWLNDNIISFYFQYLENTYKNHPSMLFVSPEVTQCMKMFSPSLKMFLEPLDANTRDYIFFALNNNDSPLHPGGTHWSLLVLAIDEETAFHYDSWGGSNKEDAQALANKLFHYFDIAMDKAHIKEVDSAQQSNGYDCGIFVICNAERIAKHISIHGSLSNYNAKDQDLQDDAKTKRKQIIDLIEYLGKQSANSRN